MTASGATQSVVYQNEGGQVQVKATTTLSDGGTVTDCTTFYIEGPADGVPNKSETDQLVNSSQSYPSSSSYPSGGTPGLMAQVADVESTYRQFTSPVDTPANADLWRLQADFGITAKWPDESPGGGAYIGLMQVMTDPNQITAPAGSTPDPNAWNWITNASDGVKLFSGTPPAEFQDAENKIQHATDYENEMIQEYLSTPPISTLPPLPGADLERMALLLYGGFGGGGLTKQYYIPVCSSGVFFYSQFTVNWVCVGGTWSWMENSIGNPKGTAYADNVEAATVPQ